MLKSLLWIGAFTLVLSTAYATETKESFEAAYQAAEAARQQAAEVGFEWRDTELMLEEAKSAADAGDYDSAVQMAREAQMQGKLGVEQAQREAEDWKKRVVQ